VQIVNAVIQARLIPLIPAEPRHPHPLFAVLGTDLGTERGGIDANKRDGVKEPGRLNAVDL
jgi:hypothetical protein